MDILVRIVHGNSFSQISYVNELKLRPTKFRLLFYVWKILEFKKSRSF